MLEAKATLMDTEALKVLEQSSSNIGIDLVLNMPDESYEYITVKNG